jgi:hypothetical protein
MRSFLTTTVVAMLLAVPASAATVLAYNPLTPEAFSAPTVEGVGVTGDNLTRGKGITQNTGNSFNSRGWTEADLAGAQAEDDVLRWGLSSTTAYDLTELEIAYDRSGTGAMSIELFYSLDGGSMMSLFTDNAIDENGESTSIDLSFLDGVTDLRFELFGWGASSPNGTFDIEPNRVGMTDAFGIFISGEAVSAVPLPAALPMLAGALGLFGLVRRKA